MDNWRADRRAVLATIASTGVAAGLAGCSSGGGGGDGGDGGNPETDGDDGADGTGDGDGSGDDGDSPPTGFETLWEEALPPDSVSPEEYRTAIGSDFLAVAVDHTLYGVDTADGTVAWEFADGGTIDALAVTDTHVYLHHSARTGPGTVYAVGKESGEVDGQRQGGSDPLPMLALDDYVVIPHQYHSLEDGLYVMDTEGGLNGSLIEQEGVNWVAGEGNYVAVGRGDPNSGIEVLGYELTVDAAAERIWDVQDLELYAAGVVGGTLVAPNEDAFTLLDVETGERTDVPVDADLGVSGRVATAGGRAFYVDYAEGVLYAVDPETEEVAWTVEEDMDGYTRMAAAGDVVVLRRDGNFRAIDPDSGETVAQGGDPIDGAAGFAAHAGAVYSCDATVAAYDAEFSG